MTDTNSAAYYQEYYADHERQTSRRKLDFYLALVRKWVPRGKRLFELGVGLGHFLQVAAPEYECQGCDINRSGLSSARNKVPECHLLEGSYECIPSRPTQDVIVSWDVLEHIPQLNAALSFIHSKLDSGGFLIGTVPVYDGPLGRLVGILDRDPTHVSKLSRWQWIDILKSHGFEVVDYGGVISNLLWSRWYVHVTCLQSVLLRIGSALYFVARKV